MKYFATLFLLFVSTIVFGAQPTVIEKAHAATRAIGQQTVEAGPNVCSATAIAPHALLTSTHCELPTNDLAIDSLDKMVTIVDRIRDGSGHSIYLLDGVSFHDYAPVKIADPLNQGEEVFLFGNPDGYADLYRKGYVMGYHSEPGKLDIVLFDFQSYFGDSGAALFNSNGEVAGLFSFIVAVGEAKENAARIQFAGGYRLQFTEQDISRALNFVPAPTK